jgi:hypothetical protein
VPFLDLNGLTYHSFFKSLTGLSHAITPAQYTKEHRYQNDPKFLNDGNNGHYYVPLLTSIKLPIYQSLFSTLAENRMTD